MSPTLLEEKASLDYLTTYVKKQRDQRLVSAESCLRSSLVQDFVFGFSYPILSPGIGEGSWRDEDNLTRDRTISDLGVWACSWGFVKEWVASENSSLESAWLRMGWFLLQRCSQAAHLELDPNLSPVQFGLLDILTVLDAGVGCVCVFVAGASLNLSDS